MSESQEAKSFAECSASRCDGKMVDEDGEELYSLQEVIENENKSNEIARAVLGASDSVNCSYEKGYVYRQALYGCQTCYNQTKHLHGLCLACSYNCHKDHILYELYTKRNFRCDCGNSKFDKDFKCELKPNKDPTNESNKYNHNFNGLYCDCNKPYETLADEQEAIVNDDDDDEMIQCAICEDWYHLNHLKGYCDRVVDYNEIVCHNCMKSNNYLWYYRDFMALAYLDSKSVFFVV
jgi:E3 ubiquitin-protein ligase UBR7